MADSRHADVDDAERAALFQSIVDVLLAGGYFRARISSLLPFDKLTGGLAWCIAASNVDVDYDYLDYDDDATLGEKIQIGESIELALQRMGCPHPLQAHQIQGLDYPAVLPVVQWLVKRVLATREELGDQVRRYSHFRFRQDYELPAEPALHPDSIRSLAQDLSSGKLQRVYRRSRNFPLRNDQNVRLHYTLLEYGKQSAQSEALPSSSSEEICPSESTDGFLSGSNLKSIFESGGNLEEIDTIPSFKDQIDALRKQIEWSEAKVSNMNEAMMQCSLVEKQQRVEEQVKRREFLQSEMAKLRTTVDSSEGEDFLNRLVEILKDLKIVENEKNVFLDACKSKQEEMQNQIEQLKEKLLLSNDEEPEEIKAAFARDFERRSDLRTELAKVSRAVVLLQRRLDDVPAQSELVQYERCFMELYVNIQAKLRETRKYFAAYNALAEANELSVKEISLLNSINSQYEMAMSTPGGRAKFVESMQGISSGVEQKLHKMEARCREKKTTYSLLKEKHAAALAAQRHYYTLVKRLQEEYPKNEKLHSSNLMLNR